MVSIEYLDRVDINDLLCRFFLAFDERNWEMMTETLADEVSIDYSSSGREQPSVMSGADFVRRRREAVDSLSKHHSFSNLLLTSGPTGLRGRCNYLILRFARDVSDQSDDFYHSCGSYEFGFIRTSGIWQISAITQKALQSWGNRGLHGGSRKGAPATPSV